MKKRSKSENTAKNKTLTLRGEKVILDLDLAKHYGITAKTLKAEIKRNKGGFPKELMFQLNAKEKAEIIKNYEHLSELKSSKAKPYAFTSLGAIMAASVLKSSCAN